MSTDGNSYGHSTLQLPSIKRKRNLPGTPDPEAEVVVLSPEALMATNRFVCDICQKGFQRDQNLQLHRRGHNLPWKLGRQHRPLLNSKEDDDNCRRKRVYVCPEPDCVHHDPSRALGDLTGIKKHYFRKHGEKKWKCNKCNKLYAVQSDWKAHSKTCGTREYQCECGTIFSRKDSFVTHRAFCEALAEESARMSSTHPNGETPSTIEAPLMKEKSTDHLLSSNNIGMRDSSPNMPSLTIPLNENGFPGSTNQSITTSGIPPTTSNPPPLLSLWPDSSGGSLSNSSDSGSFPYIRQSGFKSRGMELNLAKIPILGGNNNSNSNSTLANIFPSNSSINYGMLNSSGGLLHTSPTATTTTQAGLSISSTQQGILSPWNAEKSRSCSATLSATALLQKAAQMGATMSSSSLLRGFRMMSSDGLEVHDVTTSAPPCRGGSLFGVGINSTPFLQRPSLLGSSLIAPSLLGSNMESMNRVLIESQTGLNRALFESQNGQRGAVNQLESQKDGSDRMTVDFLGVGGRSAPRIIGGLVGQTQLSHRDIHSSIALFPELALSNQYDCVKSLESDRLYLG